MSDYSVSVADTVPAGSKRSRVPSTKAVLAAASAGDLSPTDSGAAVSSSSGAGANKKKKTGDVGMAAPAVASDHAAAGLALQPLVAAAANAALNQSKGGAAVPVAVPTTTAPAPAAAAAAAAPRPAPIVAASSGSVAPPPVAGVRTSSRAKTTRKPQLQDAMTDDDLDDDQDEGDEDMQRAVAASTAAASAAANPLPSVLTGAVTPSATSLFNPASMAFPMAFPFPPLGPMSGAGGAAGSSAAAAAAAAGGPPMSAADQSAMMAMFQQQMNTMMAMTAGMTPEQVMQQAKRMQVGLTGKKVLKKDIQEEKQREFLSNALAGVVPPALDFGAGVPQIKDPPKSLMRNACLLSSLPDDWQFKVYSFLSGSEVSTLSCTSKYFHTKTASPAVWKNVCMQTMKYMCNHAAHPWKELFITRKLKLLDKFKVNTHVES